MIDQIEHLTRKSWSDYTGPASGFRKCNLVFGLNGSGKSSLAEGIRDAAVDASGEESVRLFNRSYMEESLLLENHKELHGVKASFGKRDVDVEKEIAGLQMSIEGLEKDRDDAARRRDEAHEHFQNDLRKTFDSVKGKQRINQKSAKAPSEIIRAWERDYRFAKDKHPAMGFEDFNGSVNFQAKIDQLEAFEVPNPPAISEGRIRSATDILAKRYPDDAIPTQQVLQWIDRGLEIHPESSETCKFCGAPLDLREIRARVESYRANEKAGDQQFLYELERDARGISEAIDSIRRRKAALYALVGEGRLPASVAGWFESDAGDGVSALLGALDAKLSDMDAQIDLGPSAFDCIERASTAFDEIRATIKDEIAELQAQEAEAAALTKGAIGFRVSTDSGLRRQADIYDDAVRAISHLEPEIREKRERVRKLEQSKSDISDFARFLNEVLEELDLPFRLESTPGQSYVLSLAGGEGPSGDEHLTVEDLSEGERNLLALMFFFYSLYSDDQQEHLMEGIETIIVDDPTSSMDSQNRFYVIELMRCLFESGAQVFVLTHVWDDFCALSHGRDKDGSFSLLEVVKSGGMSGLEACKLNVEPYHRLFAEVYRFSQMEDDDPEFDSLAIHMSNAIRRVLQEYLRFCGVQTVSSGKERVIGEALYPDTKWDDLSNTRKRKVGKLVAVSNVFSHQVSRPENNREIQECAKVLMNAIKEAVPKHFHAMKMV